MPAKHPGGVLRSRLAAAVPTEVEFMLRTFTISFGFDKKTTSLKEPADFNSKTIMKTLLSRFFVAGSIFLPLAWPATGVAQIIGQITDLNAAGAPVSYAGNLMDNIFVAPPDGQSLTPAAPPAPNLGSFNLVIAPGATLSGNAAAVAAFNRAANSWAARISDPITITINADLAALGAGVIGSTASTFLQAGFNVIRNQVVTDAATDIDDGIMAFTPTAAQFSAVMPAGRTLGPNILATKANLKALGFTGLDASFGVSDATITFSTSFAFDFDNSDGVTPGTVDFQTVAAHEIGHALGFVSFVDSVVAGATEVDPFVLDLLRFGNNIAGQDPATAADFTLFPRNFVPGTDAITDAINDPEWRMSTGVTGGDGRQASHWKADELTGVLIGLMDPTLANGVAYGPTAADFRAFDLIGYDILPIPEPGSLSLLLLAGASFMTFRRCRRS